MKTWIIARREVSSYLDQPMAYVVVPGFLVLSAAYLFILNPFFVIDRATVRPFFEFTPVIFTFFIPALAMGLLAEDRKTGILDLVLSWPIGIGSMVCGKFLGAAALICTTLVLTLPYSLSINYIGELDWGPVAGGYLGLLLLALSNLSIGLFLSALTKNQLIAFVTAFLLCFSLYICGRLSPFVSPGTGQILTFISFETHFASIARGVLDVRDIVYFLTVIGLFLALATEAVRFGRWPRPIPLNTAVRESGLFVALVMVLATAVNMASAQGVPRLDLTADGRYTLPESTRQILAQATVPIAIKAYLPTHVQPPYSTVVTAMVDKLAEYVEAAPAGIDLTITDPSDPDLDPTSRERIADDARRLGIEQRELQVQQGDRMYRERVWFGVALVYQDRTQTIGALTRVEDLDLALTRALRDLIYAETSRITIGVASGHGEPDIINSPLAQKLEETGSLERVAFQGKPIPGNIDVLVILGPRKAYNEADRYILDQYLMRGGAIVALLDYRTPSSMFPNVLVNVHTGLESLFKAYGLEIDPRYTVIDRVQNAPTPPKEAGQPSGQNSPLYPRITDLHNTHPISEGLSQITMPMSVPMTIKDTRWTSIARGGNHAILHPGINRTDIGLYDKPAAGELVGGQPIVSAVTEGLMKSAFAGLAPPEGLNINADYPRLDRGHSDARIFIATSGVRMLGTERDGLILLQNAIDWAALQTDLVEIRNRTVRTPTLSADDPTLRTMIKMGNLFGPGLLCLLFGFARRKLRAPV